MDPDVEVMYQVISPGGIQRSDLHVSLSESYNRLHPLPDPYEQELHQVWAQRCEKNPKLWNGTKFRIHSITDKSGAITFNLGITDYKDFLGTNWAPYAQQLIEQGTKQHNNRSCYMSDALGVGNLVITKDQLVILIRRSEHCGEAQGLLDVPGGHPEPQELVGKLLSHEIDLSSLNTKDVVNEIFNSTLNEVIQEVNIPASALTDPVLIGVARNKCSAGRPSSEYIVHCSLTSSEVRDLYTQGTQSEAEESTALIMLPLTSILNLQSDAEIWPQVAPSAKGCIILYQQLMKRS